MPQHQWQNLDETLNLQVSLLEFGVCSAAVEMWR